MYRWNLRRWSEWGKSNLFCFIQKCWFNFTICFSLLFFSWPGHDIFSSYVAPVFFSLYTCRFTGRSVGSWRVKTVKHFLYCLMFWVGVKSNFMKILEYGLWRCACSHPPNELEWARRWSWAYLSHQWFPFL